MFSGFIPRVHSNVITQDKSTLAEDKLDDIAAIIGDEEQAKAVLKAAKASMGFDISEQDLFNVVMFTERMISLAEYRKQVSYFGRTSRFPSR